MKNVIGFVMCLLCLECELHALNYGNAFMIHKNLISLYFN